MPFINIDLQDDKPPVSFSLNLRDTARFQDFMAECHAFELENTEMRGLLLRLADAVEALDGTNTENEKLVDDYRALFAK